MYGDADRVCPMDTVEWMMGEIGHMIYGNYQFGGYDHSDFGKANDQVFMSELHEALSHLQPHLGVLDSEEQFHEDLAHSLEQEIDYSHHAQFEHSVMGHDSFDLGHLEPDVVVHEDPEGLGAAHWRDDKYHDHGGFDLRANANEEHGSEHVNSDHAGYNLSYKNFKSDRQDGVEHDHRPDKRIEDLKKEYKDRGFRDRYSAFLQ